VRGICLVDLDTLGLGTMAFELGDAMRSWCNPHGEDAGSVTFDLPIFAAAIRGFRAVADELVSADERTSIVVGLETVCVELAARFAVDVFRDEYFGWDPARFRRGARTTSFAPAASSRWGSRSARPGPTRSRSFITARS